MQQWLALTAAAAAAAAATAGVTTAHARTP